MSYRTHLSQLAALMVFSCLILILAAAPVAANCVDAPSGLQGWWPLDDSSSSSTAQNFSSGLDGTYYGATYLAFGKVSHARTFGGDNDHVLVPDHSSIDIGTADFTIEAWIKTTGGSGVRTITDKRPASFPHTGYHLFLWNGRISLQLADSSGWQNFYGDSSTPYLADGQWHHVAATVDRNSTSGVRFYVDGSVAGWPQNPTGKQGSLANSEPLYIGRRHDSVPSASWLGQIDEVAIYNRVLTGFEIDDIYEAGPFGKCKNCVPTQALAVDLLCSSHFPLTEHDCFALATGGCGPYNYSWTWTGGGSLIPSLDSCNIVNCNQAGVVTVTATDQGGNSASDSAFLQCSSGGCNPFCF
ncbi:MAG: LamG domain-containing protein [Acidobacteriota bacterium]